MRLSRSLPVPIPVETNLITMLCRTPLTSEGRERIGQLLDGEVDWARLLSTAAAWEVEPAALNNLRTHFLDSLPDGYEEAIAARERIVRAFALTRALVTLQLVKKLSGFGIPVLVLKGAALASMAYGDVSMRTYSDVDLLLTRDDLLRAKDFLVSLGYNPFYEPGAEAGLIRDQHALELSDSANKVELHWALLSRHLCIDIDSEELNASSAQVELAGGTVQALAPHHLLLFVCAHGTKHQWMNPRWICDVAQLAQRLSPREIDATIELADRTHTRRILAFALRVARDVIGFDVPSAFAGRLVPESETRWLVASVVQRVFPKRRDNALRPPIQRFNPNTTALLYWSLSRERMIDRANTFARLLVRRL